MDDDHVISPRFTRFIDLSLHLLPPPLDNIPFEDKDGHFRLSLSSVKARESVIDPAAYYSS